MTATPLQPTDRRDGAAPAAGPSADPSEDPLARALGYPYPWHPGPVLFDPGSGTHDAHVVDIGPEREHVIAGLRMPVPARAIAVRAAGQTIEIEDAVALIAAGSNGSPVQLARKYRDRGHGRPFLVAPARVSGAVSVYSAHITSYGSIPATMYASSGHTGSGHAGSGHTGPERGDSVAAALPVLLLPAGELAHINATESLGVNYVLAAPHGVSLTVEAVEIARPLAYVSLRGAVSLGGPAGMPVRLPGSGGNGTGYAEAGQREMIERVMAYVGEGGSLEAFVMRMIQDKAARADVTARLAETARRWELNADEIVADGA